MTKAQPIESNSGGYSTEYYNRIRQTRLLKLVLKTGTITLVALFVLRYIATEYFVNLPHERRDLKLSYQETLYSGIYQSYIVLKNFLTTPEVDFKNSKLPKVELFIRQSRIASLNSNLPYSGRVEKTAYLKVDKKIHKVKARYRGDSVNHWAYPVKSWRIIMPKGEFYQGMREFNLYQPRFQHHSFK